MNIEDWQKQVWNCPNMNSTAVAICLALGSHGNWSKSQTVWCSRQRISNMTGASREVVGKYLTALEEQGWLKVVATRENNVREYEMTKPPVVVVYDNLAIKQRGSKAKLRNQVVVDNEPLVVDYDNPVVVDNDSVVVDYDTNLPRTYQENLPKELTNTSTGPSDAVHQDVDDSLGEPPMPTHPSLTSEEPHASFNKVDMLSSVLEGTRYLTGISKEQKNQIRDLALNHKWNRTESRPNFRTQAAIKEVLVNV